MRPPRDPTFLQISVKWLLMFLFVMVLLRLEYSMYALLVSNVVQQCAPSLMLSLRSEGEAKCPCSPKASCPLGCGLNKTQHWCRGELEWPQPILYFNAFDTIPCLTCISFLGHSGGDRPIHT